MKTYTLIIGLLLLASSSYAQEIKNVDYVSPPHEDLAAVKSGNRWGFINLKGAYAIPLRENLVVSSHGDKEMPYPYFSKDRAIYKEVRDNIDFYGFIDSKGSIAISAKYIEVTPFNEYGYALALELFKQTIGENDLLNKPIIRYEYNEVVIDTSGKAVLYISEAKHIIPMRNELRKTQRINSYLIGPNLVVIQNKKGAWDILKTIKN